MRYMGIDYGSKRVGISISDENGTMGFPHSILANTRHLIDDICALIKKENIETVVIGESRNLSGEDNPIAKEARAFGDLIAERAGISVQYESEIFTSAEARRFAPPNSEVDSSAASIILTSYLSKKNHG